MNLLEFIQRFTEQNLNLKQIEIDQLAGHNGPYFDPELPARNAAHWLFTLSKLYEITEEKNYLSGINRLFDYLVSDDLRPFGFTIYQRDKLGKDRCNGLIGQAWAFEALIAASNVLDREDIHSLIKEIFLSHEFDSDKGLWKILEIDGTILDYDYAFNHQLWFASSVIPLIDDKAIELVISRFIDKLMDIVDTEESGLIKHIIWLDKIFPNRSPDYKKALKQLLKKTNLENTFYRVLGKENPESQWHYRSIGYHIFNLYAFAIIRKKIPDHIFWTSNKFQSMIEYSLSKGFQTEVGSNKYSFPYNPPGFEFPFVISELVDEEDDQKKSLQTHWLDMQLEKTFTPNEFSFSKNVPDYKTLNARIYELMRLDQEELMTLKLNVK